MTQPKNTLTLATFIIFALVFGSCGKSGGPGNGLSTENKVVWYIPSDVESINPLLVGDEGGNYVDAQIFETLSSQNPRTQAFIPWLASLPVESPDHLTFTFTMDPAAHWSDGKPVTAEDVIYTYKVMDNPYVINAAPVRSYFAAFDSCWIPAGQPNVVIFHWKQYRYDLLKIMNYVKILPKHVWDPTDLTGKFSWAELKVENPSNPAIKQVADKYQDPATQRDPAHILGSGPYKFETWITNDRVSMRRDTNYWAKNKPWGEAYVDQITIKTIKDPNAALIALKHQDIDIDQYLSGPQYLSGLDSAQDKYIKKDTVFENSISYIGWNNAKPLFSDVKVRKALTMLIDRDKIIHAILKNMSKKIEGPVAPSQPDFDPTVKQPAYNPDSAKTLLTEAGWKMGPDGILQKMIGGTLTPFKFTFQIPSGSEVPKQILLIVVNDMKKVGISAEISQLEFSVFLQNMRNRQFDAHMASWIGNMTGPEGVEDEISQKWESTQIKNKGSNEDAYSNPEADKLMEAIKVEPDRAKRFEMSHRLQHIVVDDQPQTFLWSTPERIAWLDRFDNFEFFPSRPPFAPAFWIVRGSGVKRGPHDAVMSMNPSERTEPQ